MLKRVMKGDANFGLALNFSPIIIKIGPIRQALINKRNIMNIYIASSAKNLHGVRLLRDALTARGHTVLDWTAMAPPLPDYLSPEERRMALDSDERGEIFDFCAKASTGAQALIYFGPAGQDAACEVGMAWAAGVPTIGLAAPTEKPGLILNRAVRFWAAGLEECLATIENMDKSIAAGHNG